MIPKKIHYFWFGKGQKSALEQECISRFTQFAPGVEIIEWTEDNFDVNTHPYTRQAYADKKWAFVSDYARLKVLYEEGGIYLDTDMYLVKDISELFSMGTFFGKEDDTHINAAVFGCAAKDRFIGDVLKKYDVLVDRITIPKVITEVFAQSDYEVTIFDNRYFYPFNQNTINQFNKTNQPKESYMVHMWNYSWGNPVIKKLKKYNAYKYTVRLLEKIKIKSTLKKLFKME